MDTSELLNWGLGAVVPLVLAWARVKAKQSQTAETVLSAVIAGVESYAQTRGADGRHVKKSIRNVAHVEGVEGPLRKRVDKVTRKARLDRSEPGVSLPTALMLFLGLGLMLGPVSQAQSAGEPVPYTAGGAVLTWTFNDASDQVTAYKIFRIGGGVTNLVWTAQSTTNAVPVFSLVYAQPFGVYGFTLSAVNAAGESDRCEPVWIKYSSGRPGVPRDVKIRAATP